MKIVLLESLGISQKLLEQLQEPFIKEGHEFVSYERTTVETTLISEVEDADVLILANMPLRGSVIRACHHLKFIDVAFTGVDHIDLDAAREKKVAVSNAAGYSTEAVAELVIGQMIHLLRNVTETEVRCRNHGTISGLIGRELSGSTVGIIGTGAIGCRVAQLCRAMGSQVLGYAPRPNAKGNQVLTYVSLDDLLRTSDIVTLHCPLTDETRGMIGQRELSLMKQDAFLINMARGPVVDIPALAEALESKTIAGAAVDVFETEPPLSQDHPLLQAPRCLVTPHIAFASRESMELRACIVFDSLQQWLNGHQINCVL